VRLYGVSRNARVAALFNIVELTTAFYDKHLADQFEYSLPPGSDRCVKGEAAARCPGGMRQFVERRLASEPALDKPQGLSRDFHIGSQRKQSIDVPKSTATRLIGIASESQAQLGHGPQRRPRFVLQS
jgi:hypothetical protein